MKSWNPHLKFSPNPFKDRFPSPPPWSSQENHTFPWFSHTIRFMPYVLKIKPLVKLRSISLESNKPHVFETIPLKPVFSVWSWYGLLRPRIGHPSLTGKNPVFLVQHRQTRQVNWTNSIYEIPINSGTGRDVPMTVLLIYLFYELDEQILILHYLGLQLKGIHAMD